jgi:hypothetical protein
VGDPATGKSIPAEKITDMLRIVPMGTGFFTVHSGELTKIHLLKSLQASCLHKQLHEITPKELLQKASDPSIILHGDELAAEIGEGDFAFDLIKHLVQMYAVPEHYDYGTDKHGRIAIERPLINWIACTTIPWLMQAVPTHSAASGLTARVNTITAPFPTTPDEDIIWNEQLWKDLYNDLVSISLLKGPFELDQLAKEKRQELKREAHEKRKNMKDDIERAQYGREGDQALKLAMALSAAVREDRIITENILTNAYALVTNARDTSLDLYVHTAGRPAIQLKMKILSKLKQVSPMTRQKIASLMWRDGNTEEVTKALESLMAEGQVSGGIMKDGTNYYEWIDNTKPKGGANANGSNPTNRGNQIQGPGTQAI